MKRFCFYSMVAVFSLIAVACNKQQPVKLVEPTYISEDCSDSMDREDALQTENEALRKLADRRQALFDALRKELAGLIDSGKLKLVFRRGMIVLQMPNQILYQSGSATLKEEGSETVQTVGEALSNITDRRFLVAGHTDTQPIKKSEWQSNWHLSSARAQVVLMVLVESGVNPDQLAAAGFGEYDPVDSNDDEEEMRQNRRTEIMVVPNLEQIFSTIKGPSVK